MGLFTKDKKNNLNSEGSSLEGSLESSVPNKYKEYEVFIDKIASIIENSPCLSDLGKAYKTHYSFSLKGKTYIVSNNGSMRIYPTFRKSIYLDVNLFTKSAPQIAEKMKKIHSALEKKFEIENCKMISKKEAKRLKSIEKILKKL